MKKWETLLIFSLFDQTTQPGKIPRAARAVSFDDDVYKVRILLAVRFGERNK